MTETIQRGAFVGESGGERFMAGFVLLRVGIARAFGFEDVTLVLESVSAFLGFDLAQAFLARVFQCHGDACLASRERGFHLVLLFKHVRVCGV